MDIRRRVALLDHEFQGIVSELETRLSRVALRLAPHVGHQASIARALANLAVVRAEMRHALSAVQEFAGEDLAAAEQLVGIGDRHE